MTPKHACAVWCFCVPFKWRMLRKSGTVAYKNGNFPTLHTYAGVRLLNNSVKIIMVIHISILVVDNGRCYAVWISYKHNLLPPSVFIFFTPPFHQSTPCANGEWRYEMVKNMVQLQASVTTVMKLQFPSKQCSDRHCSYSRQVNITFTKHCVYLLLYTLPASMCLSQANLHQHLVHLVCHFSHPHADLTVLGPYLGQKDWQVRVRRWNGWWRAYSSGRQREHLLGANCWLRHQRVQLSLPLHKWQWIIHSLQHTRACHERHQYQLKCISSGYTEILWICRIYGSDSSGQLLR
jgi:hypothetical protein